jgi:hypothetical protein
MTRYDNFLVDRMDAPVIDGQGLAPDPDLVQRNLERAKQVIAAMGQKWCLHPNYKRAANEHGTV